MAGRRWYEPKRRWLVGGVEDMRWVVGFGMSGVGQTRRALPLVSLVSYILQEGDQLLPLGPRGRNADLVPAVVSERQDCGHG